MARFDSVLNVTREPCISPGGYTPSFTRRQVHRKVVAPTFTASLTRGAAPWLPSTQEERSTPATTMTVRDAREYAAKKREGKEEGRKKS